MYVLTYVLMYVCLYVCIMYNIRIYVCMYVCMYHIFTCLKNWGVFTAVLIRLQNIYIYKLTINA